MSLFDTHTVPVSHPALPPSLAAAVAPIRVSFAFSRAERKVCRKRRDIKTSEHAARHRVLSPKDSDYSGPWRNELTPYLAGIMDAVFFPSVRHMVVCAPPQTGKSEATNNIVAKIIDRLPGNTLYVYPGEKDAKKNIKRRVLAMIKSSPRLSSYLTGKNEDEANALINLMHMTIRAGWSGSPQSLASTPERYVILEETDKYADRLSDKEASSRLLAFKRTRTYRGREKKIEISTPTTESGPIWQALLEMEVIFEYVVLCPFCDHHQPMDLGDRESAGGLKWPEDCRDPNLIENQELAWYQCWHCQAKWDNRLRDKAAGPGYWRDKKSGLELFTYLERKRPRKIGFQYSALISTFVSLSEYAAAFLKGAKNKADLKDFLNGYAAEPWHIYEVARKGAAILALRDTRPQGLVPGSGQVAALVAGVDTQDDGFYFVIRAYGYGLSQESWLIAHGYLRSTETVKEVLFSHEYRDAAGLIYPVHLACQDAMGHRTREMYDFARHHPGRLQACKGASGRKAQPHSFSKIDTYPGSKQMIPGGVTLAHVDVNHYKDQLSGMLMVAPTDPGAFHLHAATTADYAAQLCAEYVDEARNLWTCPPGKANHYWDCEVLALAAADMLRLKFWPRPEEIQPTAAAGEVSKGVEY